MTNPVLALQSHDLEVLEVICHLLVAEAEGPLHVDVLPHLRSLRDVGGRQLCSHRGGLSAALPIVVPTAILPLVLIIAFPSLLPATVYPSALRPALLGLQELPDTAALLPEAGVAMLGSGARLVVDTLGIALALGGPRAALGLAVSRHVSDGEARLATIRGADDLGMGIALLHAFWILLPNQRAILEVLSQNHALLISLQHDVGAVLRARSLLCALYALHVLRHLRDPLLHLELLAHPDRGRKDCSDDLLFAWLLGGAHFEAALPIDPERHAILGGLREGDCGRLQILKEHGLPRVASQVHGRGHPCAARNLEGWCPRGWKEGAGLARREVLAEKVLLPLRPHCLLRFQEATQIVHISGGRVRRHEAIALASPVRKVGVEDALEQVPVLFLHRCDGGGGQGRPEGIADGEVTTQGAPAPTAHRPVGLGILGDLCR
mmetsp:Transcript_23986/g.50932  ORF Transcript_23986/g.50932 Transcript_23986/m.50932 type:complete len:435 (+) Transcript_23986:105-1409(+)